MLSQTTHQQMVKTFRFAAGAYGGFMIGGLVFVLIAMLEFQVQPLPILVVVIRGLALVIGVWVGLRAGRWVIKKDNFLTHFFGKLGICFLSAFMGGITYVFFPRPWVLGLFVIAGAIVLLIYDHYYETRNALKPPIDN